VSRSGTKREYIDVVRGGKECKLISTKYIYKNGEWLPVATKVMLAATVTNRDRKIRSRWKLLG
jgi:hypothetical protein